MTRQITYFLRSVLGLVLAVSILLSGNARSVAHDVTQVAQIIAAHHAEIEEHGHAHDDIVDLMHAYHEHSHEIADHDHNIAFLPTRDAASTQMPTSSGWAMAHRGLPDRTDYGLDRPPRV